MRKLTRLNVRPQVSRWVNEKLVLLPEGGGGFNQGLPLIPCM